MRETGEEGGNKDDRGKHMEGERKAKPGEFLRLTNVAEDKRGTRVGKTQELVCAGAEETKHGTAYSGTENEKAKRQLEPQAPSDDLELDRPPGSGEDSGQPKNHRHAECSGNTSPDH